MVAAVAAVTPIRYAAIVASKASKSAGPGTRANIDEFTTTTARAIERVGGAQRGKAVIILNPVEPPMIKRDTVFCAISADADTDAITASVHAMADEVARYVPGYALRADPQFDPPADDWSGWARVAVFLQVRGNGDYLPTWAGNLDIMTAAAARVGELLAVAARTEVPSEPRGRGADWTEERGTSDEGRRRLKAPRRRTEGRARGSAATGCRRAASGATR